MRGVVSRLPRVVGLQPIPQTGNPQMADVSPLRHRMIEHVTVPRTVVGNPAIRRLDICPEAAVRCCMRHVATLPGRGPHVMRPLMNRRLSHAHRSAASVNAGDGAVRSVPHAGMADPNNAATRVSDMPAPCGDGQRSSSPNYMRFGAPTCLPQSRNTAVYPSTVRYKPHSRRHRRFSSIRLQ